MNWFDIVLLAILAWSVFISFKRGFTREIVGLISVIAALLLGAWFYGTAAGYLSPFLSSHRLANLAGFLVIFFGVLLLGSAVGFAVGKFLKVTGLSIVDHALGAAFGAIRGLVIAVALVLATMAFAAGDGPPRFVVRSRVAPYVVDAARLASAIAPFELKQGFRKSYAQVKTIWGRALQGGLGNDSGREKDRDEREL